MEPTTRDAVRPAVTSPESFVAQSERSPTPLKHLCWFVLSIITISLLLSAAASLWVELSWWKIFRRCVSISATLSLWLMLRYVHHNSLRSLGLGPWKQGRRHVLQGAFLGFGTVLLIAGFYMVTGVWRIHIHPDAWRLFRTLIGFLPAAGLIAVLEELVFRGYVLRQLLLAWPARLAVTTTSAAYALVHLRAYPVWPQSGFELIGLFVLGCVLAFSYLRTGQLYLSIGLHASMAYCARVNKLLVEPGDASWQWLFGSNRLVNGVVVWLALLAIGWVIARSATRTQT